MGFVRYLQRIIASLLRPFILQKEALEPILLHFHPSRIVVESRSLELDCASINSSLLSDSQFVLRHARVNHAELSLSFFRSPGLRLTIHGVHFVFNVRPPDDSFWSDRQKKLAEASRNIEMTALDPLGASVHLAAQRHLREAVTENIVKSFLAKLLLQALHVELNDVSFEHRLNTNNICNAVYFLTLGSLVLQQGYGIFGISVRWLVNVLKVSDDFYCKVCSVQKFGLVLLTSDEQSEQVKSPLSCVSLDALQSSKSSGKNNILTWTKITLILGFRNIELSGIDAAFSETILQFNVIEAEAIIKLLTTGSYKGAPGDSSRAGQSQNSQGLCESARLHWKKACESIIGNLPKKLTRITEVRMLCQRYTEIYACWLLKSGEGTFVDLGMVKCAEELKWRKSDLCSLEKDLLCLEEELPMEAIVLARFRSRKKIFTDPNRIVFTARPPAFSVRSKVSVLEALKTAYKMVKRVLMNFFNILVVFLKHFFFILGIKWVFLKWGNVLSSKCCIALAKSHAWLDSCHSAISPIMPEALEKCNYLKSKKLEGWMNFCCNFHTGSVTFVGSLECFRSFQERNGLKYWIQLLQGRYLPGLHFAFDDVSLGYSTSTTGLGCQLVCGYVQGQLVTVPARHFNAATDIEWQSDLPFIENDQLKVFKSSSAPSIRLPSIFEHQLVANNLDMSEEAKFSEFLKKDLITSGTSGKSNSERKRPFLVCSYESVQTTDTSDGKSDMIMCSLAVGCLSWKFNLETYCLFGFLSIQLLDTMKINKQLQSNETFLSELASSCMRDPVRGLWEVSYADQLRTPILSICLEREIWLVLALASPTFEFSVNNVEAGDGFTSEPTFLVNLGLLEVTIWPARVKQDQLGAEKYNEGSKQLRSMAKGERIWLKEPPGPCIERPKTIRSSFQQGVGNNGIISLSEATMSMWGLQSPESRALIKPLSMIWKISSCRDDFRLPGVHNTACVAMTGSFSGIHMDILFEEMEIYFKACRKISEVTRELLALERTYVEAFKCKERQDVLGKDASFNEPESKVSHECVYFCVSVELEVDFILCVLLDRGIKADRQSMEGIEEQKNSQSMQSLTSDNLGAVNSRHFGPLDMHRRIDEFLVRKFHLDFSWGDGCPLLLSCGFDEWGFIVRTIPGGSGTWKDKNIVLNPISHNEYDGEKCQVLLQQFSFSIDRPWCLSEFESLKPSLLDRSEDFYHKSRACWMNIKLRMGKLYINDCLSQSFMSKILSKVADASCLTVEMVVSHDYYNISVISEGGILFIHTQALLLLSKELESYKKATSFFSPSRGKPMNVNLVLPHELGRSFSLPSGRSQEREFRTKNLYSASFASHSRDLQKDPGASSGSCTWSPESVSVRVSSLCFIVAQNQSALMGEGRGGLLLELGGSLQLQTSGRKKTFFLETEKFRLSSHLKVEDSGEMVDIPSRIPRFGSNLGVHLGESSENNADKFCSPVKDKGRTDGEGVLVHSDEFEKNSRKGLMRDKEYDYIIENLGLSVNLDKDLGYLDKSNGWHGSIVLLGLDIGVTMLELQLLMSLYSSMSSLPFISSVKSESSATRDFFKPSSDESSVNGFHIPDGSVVAVKDVHEHLYMAVQRTNGSSYRLVGVLHYSLVGDQSLFKVKYHRTSRDTSQVWFSLLSVDAKDSNGEAFRLHYCPGSGLADISSTNDGSWELWQAHPYQCSPKDESHIVGFNNDSARNLVYLVNQKSKLGLTVTTGGPMMVRQPGSLFKFKILQYGSQHNPFAQGVHPLSIGLQKPANYPPCSYITIPQVELNVGRVVFTLLFESGGKYLLPLLRGRVEDTRATMHIQSHKIRVMGGYKFVFEYLEVDSNEWLAIVQPINIDLFYRVRISPEHNSVKGTLVTSFFARFKRYV
ncbi:hypothetical protein KP509_20G047500 [Ceratopteris richardii]|uniref:Vacuolar protein sorting-associated protein 13 VPS13 adaptor binding domain-containing protein n=1 Tax=Ceratopteris richardii TaxID=49495 RepID=A0A8T2SGW9_CERRI|nr:hypothetical protein KP509_20G047500 [Ceratopteris richardii]